MEKSIKSYKILINLLMILVALVILPNYVRAEVCNDAIPISTYSAIASLSSSDIDKCAYKYNDFVFGQICPVGNERPQESGSNNIICVTDVNIRTNIQNNWKNGLKYNAKDGKTSNICTSGTWHKECVSPGDGTTCTSATCCKPNNCAVLNRNTTGYDWCTGATSTCGTCLSGYVDGDGNEATRTDDCVEPTYDNYWTKTGDNIYNTNTGNVGIGTDAPLGKFHTQASLDSNAGTQYGMISNIISSGSGITIGVRGGVSGTSNEKFGVYGRADRSDGTTAYGVYGVAFGSGGTAWSGYFTGGNVYMSDNVGIGTTSPVSKLTIAGTNAGLDVFANSTDNEGLRLQTHRSADNQTSSRILFAENNNEMYGFSLLFAGANPQTFGSTTMTYPDNKFYIINHNNNLIGNAAVTIDRANGHVGVAGSDAYVGYGLAVNDGAIINLSEDYGEGLRVVSGGNNARGIVSQTLGSDSISFSNLCTNCIAASFSGVENDGTKAVVKITNDAHTLLIDGNEIDSSVALYLNNNSDKDVILARGGGNVGIDISSPQTDLHVHDISSSTSQIQLTNNFTGSASGDGALISQSGSALWLVNRESGQLYIESSEDAYIRFRGDTERARIGPDYTNFSGNVYMSGNVGIGTTSPSAKLHINAPSGTDSLRVMNDGSTKLLVHSNGKVGISGGYFTPNYDLDVRGTIGNNTTTYHSDARWKKNVENIPDSLNKILNLRGVYFNWRTDEYTNMSFDDKKHIGLIAQEVEKIIPEVVDTGDNGYKSVQYANIVPVLVSAIQEQQKQIDDLQRQIDELKK